MALLQPFVAVALRLKDYGHRVRLATHEPHRSFVEQFGLEFYPLGGDPQILADFAVQSKGTSPDSFTLRRLSLGLLQHFKELMFKPATVHLSSMKHHPYHASIRYDATHLSALDKHP